MKIENHILDILQLYEYAMAIGKSLDYKENCDAFLKLILKRKNLNAAWILEKQNDHLITTYSIPSGQVIKTKIGIELQQELEGIATSRLFDYDDRFDAISPIEISNGYLAIYKLNALGFLVLYSKKANLTEKILTQLQPVVHKFYNSLKACKAFEEQQQLLQNLENRNQELSDYAHMVSHDLKSPLRSIDALSAWLKEDYADQLNEDANESFTLIRENVEKMDHLINGILQYSTINKNQDSTYEVDLNPLIDDIMKSIIVPKHIKFEIAPELPTIVGDTYRLQQLFQNLIENAIKYNDKSEGKIRLGIEEQGTHYQFSIQDNGKGIDKKYHEKIFNTFEKLENNPNSSGIRLSIVKKIVKLYKGEIWVESEVGIGTTFYFTLKK